MNKGVCLPGRSTGGHCSTDRYSGSVSEAGPIEKERCQNQTQAYAIIWCMNMAWVCDEIWANATSIHLHDVHLNQSFKCNSKISSYKCHSCIVWSGDCKPTMYLFSLLYYMGCCEDYLTCDISFNAVMPLSRASTRGRYSRIEGVTSCCIYENI